MYTYMDEYMIIYMDTFVCKHICSCIYKQPQYKQKQVNNNKYICIYQSKEQPWRQSPLSEQQFL